MENLDYLENIAGITDSEKLKELSSLCEQLKSTRNKLEDIEKEKKYYQDIETDLSRVKIPELLQSNGVTSLKLTSGEWIEITENLAITLPKQDPAKRKEAFDFIKSLDGGEAIIKKQLTIEEVTDSIKQALFDAGISYNENIDIHAQTLKAFFKSLLGLSKNSRATLEYSRIPKCLNPFIYKETKIK